MFHAETNQLFFTITFIINKNLVEFPLVSNEKHWLSTFVVVDYSYVKNAYLKVKVFRKNLYIPKKVVIFKVVAL